MNLDILKNECRRLEEMMDTLDEETLQREVGKLAQNVEEECRNLREQLLGFCHDLQMLHISGANFRPLPNPADVVISLEDGVLRIVMEELLPFSMKGYVYYLHTKLDEALAAYKEERNLRTPIFREKAAVVFLHHYDVHSRRYKNRQFRDFDNVEHRALMNTLRCYAVWDDSPFHIISIDALVEDVKDFTTILVMPVGRLPIWLAESDLGKTITKNWEDIIN